eukprot:3294277-Amphidinium_carterae.2
MENYEETRVHTSLDARRAMTMRRRNSPLLQAQEEQPSQSHDGAEAVRNASRVAFLLRLDVCGSVVWSLTPCIS